MTKRNRKAKVEVVDQVEVDEITEIDDDSETGVLEMVENVSAERPLIEVVKETKRRKKSSAERDETGKVLRKGKNLSGNQPFREKLYFLDLDQYNSPEGQKAVEAAPMQ